MCGLQWYRAEDRLHRLQSEISKPYDPQYERLAPEAKARFEGLQLDDVRRLNLPVTITFQTAVALNFAQGGA